MSLFFNMVVNFTIFRNLVSKSIFLSSVPRRSGSNRVLSSILNSNLMEQFAVRNVEGEDRLQMCFNFNFDSKSRVFNLDRAKTEPLNVALVRLAANIEKHFFKKKKKKAKKGEEVDEASGSSIVIDQSPVKVQLISQDGIEIPDTITNEEAWTEGVQVQINDIKYIVKVNQPTIKYLALPTCLMANFPTFPKITSEFTTDFLIKWYKGKLREGKDSSKTIHPEDVQGWIELCSASQYTPSNEDIGFALKIECFPKARDSVGFPKEAIGENIIGTGPGFCPFENRHAFTAELAANDCVRVVSYNILADLYADSDFSRENLFPLCPPYALNIDYRIQLILKEIKGYNSDILCLQEVDRKVFENELSPTLSQLGYDGYQKEKDGEMPEGSTIFFRKNKFRLISQHDINLSHSLQTEPDNQDIWENVQLSPKLQERVLERKTCLQVALLECLSEPGRHVLVGTTHLYFHPAACHIRVIQGALCVRHMEKLVQQFTQQGLKVAPIFCGDLNWGRQDGLMLYLINNEVSKNDRAWMSSGEEEYFGGMDLTHNLSLVSACGFPEYTNYVVGFCGCLDYILSDRNQFVVEQVVPMPDHEEVTMHGALPNIVFPSDHIALVCDLKWNKMVDS